MEKGSIIPVLAQFYGIIIRMYFQQVEHNPPHIHAIYGEHVAEFDVRTGHIIEGFLPPKATAMVREWISINHNDLLEIWSTQNFKRLKPLE